MTSSHSRHPFLLGLKGAFNSRFPRQSLPVVLLAERSKGSRVLFLHAGGGRLRERGTLQALLGRFDL